MSKGKVIFGVVAGLVAVYIVASPYITVYQIKSAAESHDGEALSEHIEFSSVRQNIKEQMNAMIEKKMAEDENMKDNPFSGLASLFAEKMVDRMVKVYITPGGITQLMAGEKPQVKTVEEGAKVDVASRTPLSDPSMSYASLSKFVVKVKGYDGKVGKFILRRRGIGWKVTEIIIPME